MVLTANHGVRRFGSHILLGIPGLRDSGNITRPGICLLRQLKHQLNGTYSCRAPWWQLPAWGKNHHLTCV